MEQMKIIQTPIRFYPAVGGVEKYTHSLSKELIKLGHKVKVVCADDPVSDKREIDGIIIKRVRSIGKIANTNITPFLFIELLKEDFDIVHTHIPTPWSADFSMLVSIFKRKPLILTYHNDLEKKGKEKGIALLYNATLLKLLFRRSKKIIVTSKKYINHSNYLKGYEDKIVVIPNGIDIKQFVIDSKIKKVKYQIFFLSVLDRFHEYKGLKYLLNAMPDIINRFPEARLLIGGRGELTEKYKQIAREIKISKNVVFLGYIRENELKNIYQESSVFVLPSIDKNEGFGIVLLEAMGYKTPVISTNITGVADDIKKYNTGIVVSPKNSRELSESIVKLFEDEKLIEILGKNGRKLVENKYDWEKIGREVETNYFQMIG